jgi:putative FmdB family regulatory protein
MPLYDYRCQVCGAVFERLQKSPSTPDVRCPRCDSTDIDRLPSLCAPPVTGGCPPGGG